MADHHAPVEVSPAEFEKAHASWVNFTEWAKWGVIGVVILLTLMALFLL